jgi:starch phosphorylase
MPSPRITAYFCMEFGLHEEFPIYAGGLGVLAGDYLKSAGDLRLPVVGVGLAWSKGYHVQRIDPDGYPREEYPTNTPDFMQDTRVRFVLRVAREEVPCRVLRMDRYGAVPLYFIDPLKPEHQWITYRLYDTVPDVRIAQEILLGIGGVRALHALGLNIGTYHFNEGHAAFAGVELIAGHMSSGLSFSQAWAEARKKIVFTTHTPVRAGNEEHPISDLRRMGACCELVDLELKALGGDPFNMTVAGLRLSRLANAVSQLHGETARAMWTHVSDAAPLIAITNGVHVPTWQDARIRQAYPDPAGVRRAHVQLKGELIRLVEERTGSRLSPDALTIGVARRIAPYKRNDLILREPERIAPLLKAGRLQIVFSGKAHPADRLGKAIIRNLVLLGRTYPNRVVFLENYDMGVARRLVRGCDVWLNNPARPLEASGTSGMKAALNGVLNLSILDGWWPEGCRHGETGWRIGTGDTAVRESEMMALDKQDLSALYEVLENEVLPAYERDPERWSRMMVASIEMAQTRFSSDRMAREYFEKMYAAEAPAPGPGKTR